MGVKLRTSFGNVCVTFRPHLLELPPTARFACFAGLLGGEKLENAGPPLGREGPPGGRLSRFNQASLRIHENLDVDTALRAVMDGARSLTGAPYAVITALGSSGRVEDHLARGLDPADVERMRRAPRGDPVLRVPGRPARAAAGGPPGGVRPLHRTVGVPPARIPDRLPGGADTAAGDAGGPHQQIPGLITLEIDKRAEGVATKH